jgi:hypothetical protein
MICPDHRGHRPVEDGALVNYDVQMMAWGSE